MNIVKKFFVPALASILVLGAASAYAGQQDEDQTQTDQGWGPDNQGYYHLVDDTDQGNSQDQPQPWGPDSIDQGGYYHLTANTDTSSSSEEDNTDMNTW